MKKALIVLVILIIIVLTSYRFSVSSNAYTVPGVAMEPTYVAGEKLKTSSDISKIERGSVIIYKIPMANTMTEHVVKRVVGLPNETVEIRNGKLFINNEETTVSPLTTIIDGPGIPSNLSKIDLKSDQYFVLGDNTSSSKDSRHTGPILKENIEYIVIGKM